MKKLETIEEFLARGGKITVHPPQVVEETPHVLKASSLENQVMSLDDGAHFFTKTRKATKQEKKISLKDVVDNYNLPKEVADRLKGVSVEK